MAIGSNVYCLNECLECTFETHQKMFLVSPQLVPLTFGRDIVDQGDFAQLSCIAMKGDEPMSISWTFHGESGSDPGILTTPIGMRGSMLVISSVGKDHNGNYTCTAKNEAGTASQTAVLKVNGKSSNRKALIITCTIVTIADNSKYPMLHQHSKII